MQSGICHLFEVALVPHTRTGPLDAQDSEALQAHFQKLHLNACHRVKAYPCWKGLREGRPAFAVKSLRAARLGSSAQDCLLHALEA